jgi:hypothetical protein
MIPILFMMFLQSNANEFFTGEYRVHGGGLQSCGGFNCACMADMVDRVLRRASLQLDIKSK